MMTELLQLATRNLMRARVRLAMTAAGVLVGTAAVVLLIGLTVGLQEVAESSVGSSALLTEITVFSSRFVPPDAEQEPPALDDDTIAMIQDLRGVRAVIPFLSFQGSMELRSGDYVNYAQLFGVSAETINELGLRIAEGELSLEEDQVIFGSEVPKYFVDPTASEWQPLELNVFEERLQLKLYDLTFSEDTARRIDLEPTAVLEAGTGRYDNAIFMPMTQLREFNAWALDEPLDDFQATYDQLVIRTANREVTGEVTESLRDMGLQTDGVGDFLDELNNFFGTMRVILGAVGGVALIAAAFGVANTMTMAILERTSEIGIMKAIGARNVDVLMIFLIEAMLVGLTGGVAGVLVSLFVGNVVNESITGGTTEGGINFLPINPEAIDGNLIVIQPELIAFALGLATAVGLVAGFFPAFRAARMLPVDALRYE